MHARTQAWKLNTRLQRAYRRKRQKFKLAGVIRRLMCALFTASSLREVVTSFMYFDVTQKNRWKFLISPQKLKNTVIVVNALLLIFAFVCFSRNTLKGFDENGRCRSVVRRSHSTGCGVQSSVTSYYAFDFHKHQVFQISHKLLFALRKFFHWHSRLLQSFSFLVLSSVCNLYNLCKLITRTNSLHESIGILNRFRDNTKLLGCTYFSRLNSMKN